MQFNSIAFGLFFPVVFLIYWAMQKSPLRYQNLFLTAASYFFYAYWDYRFLVLLLINSAVSYATGILIQRTGAEKRKKIFLVMSITVHLGILAFFKYYNFFVESFNQLLQNVGLQGHITTLQLILPLGISFYTFKIITYTVDIYRGDMKAVNDPIAFFAFVSFFPTMVAGPIDRARYLLPQFLRKREYSDPDARDGLRQVLNGLLKKMLIADNLAMITDDIFQYYTHYGGMTLFIGAVFFAIQIYCDFSGYSDIAIGTARLLGFKVMKNFNYPYFSRDIAEFWRRWHISLSTWFRDYVYVPLCGRRPGRWEKARHIIITFALCGLWHGADWTFIAWGTLIGIYYLPLTLRRSGRYIGTPAKGRLLPSLREAGAMVGIFIILLPAWVFFRSSNMAHAAGYFSRMFSNPFSMRIGFGPFLPMITACFILFTLEWIQRERDFMLQIGHLPVAVRWLAYYLCLAMLLMFGTYQSSNFIYAQF